MFLLFVEYLPADALIPLPDGKKCPKDTQYKENKVGRDLVKTCSCEEHCAWDLCRLAIPPDECLCGSGSQWQWDTFKNAWIAQITQGNDLYVQNVIKILCLHCIFELQHEVAICF